MAKNKDDFVDSLIRDLETIKQSAWLIGILLDTAGNDGQRARFYLQIDEIQHLQLGKVLEFEDRMKQLEAAIDETISALQSGENNVQQE